ncbi:MAG: hypothetical protein RIN55_08465 [Tissierellaceae bacterium]|nr:hypothetical protein [Tissierellaceae bacterium]
MINNRLIKIIGYIVFVTLFLYVTFFGVGPVLFADGTIQERLLTVGIIIIVYIVLVAVFRWFLRKIN